MIQTLNGSVVKGQYDKLIQGFKDLNGKHVI